MGRTPLYIASKYGFTKLVKMLLSAKARPSYSKGCNPLDAAKSEKIHQLISKAKLLEICSILVPSKKRDKEMAEEGIINFLAETMSDEDV
jgi:ankyrin repeat protein